MCNPIRTPIRNPHAAAENRGCESATRTRKGMQMLQISPTSQIRKQPVQMPWVADVADFSDIVKILLGLRVADCSYLSAQSARTWSVNRRSCNPKSLRRIRKIRNTCTPADAS